MFREIEPLGGTAGATGVAVVLRHPDGTINFDAYRERARRARRAAITSSMAGILRIVGSALSSIGSALAAPAARHPRAVTEPKGGAHPLEWARRTRRPRSRSGRP